MQKNLGVIIKQNPKDFVAGTLPYEELLSTGDWLPYAPTGENQFSNHADSMACVTFSALNVIETQYKFLTGKEINFSDRFIAKLSGTTPQGNYIQKVLDTIRQYGLVLDSDYPAPANFTWDEYYQEIPPEVMAKAVKYDITYEFGSTNYGWDLKHAPLQMIIEKVNPYHAVEMINSVSQFDSYPPYVEPQKTIHTVCKIILKLPNMTKYFKVNDHGKLGIMILEGFSGTIIFENDFAEYQTLLKITGITDTTPTIDIP